MSKLEKKRTAVYERVKAILGDGQICDRCCATFKTMNDACTAELTDLCPGFVRIEEVQSPIEREVFGFR